MRATFLLRHVVDTRFTIRKALLSEAWLCGHRSELERKVSRLLIRAGSIEYPEKFVLRFCPPLPWLYPERGRHPLWKEPIRHPPKDPRRIVLRDRLPCFSGLYGGIRMFDDCGGEDDGRVGGELDGDLQVPQDKVATLLGVVVAKAGDRTPPPAQVLEILVWNGADAGAEVERDRPERRVREGTPEGRIASDIRSGQNKEREKPCRVRLTKPES